MTATVRQLLIRKLKDSDVEAIYESVVESRAEIAAWMDWCHESYGIEDAKTWVELTTAWHSEKSQFHFGICSVDGQFLGGVGLSHVNDQAKCANLGYWVRSSATGENVAPEAVRQIAKWAFANTDLQRLEVVAATENTRSLRVAEKAGAIKEGMLRSRIRVFGKSYDATMYSIIRDDF